MAALRVGGGECSDTRALIAPPAGPGKDPLGQSPDSQAVLGWGGVGWGVSARTMAARRTDREGSLQGHTPRGPTLGNALHRLLDVARAQNRLRQALGSCELEQFLDLLPTTASSARSLFLLSLTKRGRDYCRQVTEAETEAC